MPTQAYFDKYPTFPSDVAVAELPRLSFAKLLARDQSESNMLFEACKAMGFFLLDFEGCNEGEAFLKKAETMFDLNEEVNAMEVDELMKYEYKPPHSLFGYKNIGSLKIESGAPDRFFFYNVSQDDMTGVSPSLSNPPCIEAHRPTLKDYMSQSHSIVTLICSHLDAQLHLAPGTLASLQPMNSQSGTALRMLRYPPQPADDRRTSLVGHTDIGTLTILFNITGGLQLLLTGADPCDESSWVYVRPVPGCAIVSLGDAMVEWSAGVLRSNMHRVTFAPGGQGEVTRYSLAYLVRPSGDALMRRLAGEDSLIPKLEDGEEDTVMNAREWEVFRAVAIKDGKDNARSRGGREIKLDGKRRMAEGIAFDKAGLDAIRA